MAQALLNDFSTAQRIAVLGVTGSGKSTAAKRIAQLKNARFIDFDEILWEPGEQKPWTPRPDDVQQALTAEALQTDRWVIAALGGSIKDLVMPQLDLIIYLDYSPAITFTRLVKRCIRRLILKEKCCNGNTESLPNLVGENSIIAWWFKTYRAHHKAACKTLADPHLPKTLRLTRPGQLDLLLTQLSA